MASVAIGAGSRLDMGKVIEQTFAALKRNLIPFGLAATILVGIPLLLQALLEYARIQAVSAGSMPSSVLASSGGSPSPMHSLLGLVNAFTTLILQAAITYGVVRDANGQPASLKDCLTVGLKNWFQLLRLGIVSTLGLVVGFALLVIPGVILTLAWSVAAPVKVMEGLGVMASLRRSADLTRGNRLNIFFLGAIIGIFAMVSGLALAAVSGGFVSGMDNPFRLFVLAPIVGIAWPLVTSVCFAVLYLQLREGREGVPVETLASVFD